MKKIALLGFLSVILVACEPRTPPSEPPKLSQAPEVATDGFLVAEILLSLLCNSVVLRRTIVSLTFPLFFGVEELLLFHFSNVRLLFMISQSSASLHSLAQFSPRQVIWHLLFISHVCSQILVCGPQVILH